MYLITNEGLRVLEEKGLKKILDSSFRGLSENHYLGGMIYDDEIEGYARKHKIPDLVERIEKEAESEVRSGRFVDRRELFIMCSEIIYGLLKKKLPKNLTIELKDAISAYYIYFDKFLHRIDYRGAYLWRDDKSLTLIEGDIHGDMYIEQYDLSPEKNLLFDLKPLVKKTEHKSVVGYYSDWPATLIHFITFCCQIKKPVPFKDNWEKEFYNGDFREREPGMVAEHYIKNLMYAGKGEEYSHIEVLPFIDNPFKQVDTNKNRFIILPIKSSGGFESLSFIDREDLVYLHKAKEGVELQGEIWGNPGVRFNYEQIHHAIRGVVSCIQNSGTRCQPYDAGLIFKYFPYEKFEELD